MNLDHTELLQSIRKSIMDSKKLCADWYQTRHIKPIKITQGLLESATMTNDMVLEEEKQHE